LWLQRGWFADTLDRDGWNGHLDSRLPLLTRRKGLIITLTYYLDAVRAVDDTRRLGCLDLAHRFGKDFATDRDAADAALA
jgi:hypothetical protein